MKILANDGISNNGVKELEAGGFEVITITVAQEQLESFINLMKINIKILELYPVLLLKKI